MRKGNSPAGNIGNYNILEDLRSKKTKRPANQIAEVVPQNSI
jgi:hypothetical protein